MVITVSWALIATVMRFVNLPQLHRKRNPWNARNIYKTTGVWQQSS